MKGQELTNRLIEDIKIIYSYSSDLDNPISEVLKMSKKDNPKIVDVLLSLDAYNLKTYLDKLSQFINRDERLVDHDLGSDIHLPNWKKDLTENKTKIANQFQSIIDNEQLVDMNTMQPISDYLISILDSIHEKTI
ncbi:MAG: hypothetical protein K9G70_14425 [Prolixibacteraceae bacterium]|nr:hypothetical protein [Prolixibacteraceae bacterium]